MTMVKVGIWNWNKEMQAANLWSLERTEQNNDGEMDVWSGKLNYLIYVI